MISIFRPKYKLLASPINTFTASGLKTDPIHYPDCFIKSEDKEPFVLAMNCIANIKFFFKQPESASMERLDALWSDIKYLERSLEKPHLWEELCALYIAAAFFQNKILQKKSSKKLYALLKKEGPTKDEQKIEFLLDCINIGERMGVNGIELRKYVANSLSKIEPSHEPVFDYARRLYVTY